MERRQPSNRYAMHRNIATLTSSTIVHYFPSTLNLNSRIDARTLNSLALVQALQRRVCLQQQRAFQRVFALRLLLVLVRFGQFPAHNDVEVFPRVDLVASTGEQSAILIVAVIQDVMVELLSAGCLSLLKPG